PCQQRRVPPGHRRDRHRVRADRRRLLGDPVRGPDAQAERVVGDQPALIEGQRGRALLSVPASERTHAPPWAAPPRAVGGRGFRWPRLTTGAIGRLGYWLSRPGSGPADRRIALSGGPLRLRRVDSGASALATGPNVAVPLAAGQRPILAE